MQSLIRPGKLQRILLTQREITELDPTGKGRAHLNAMRDGRPTPVPPELRALTRDGWLEWYKSVRGKVRVHPAYAEYDDAHFSKYGPQGDSFSLAELEGTLEDSYTRALSSVTFKYAIAARDQLIRIIRERIDLYGYPQPVPGKIADTSAGLPTMAKKGTFAAETTMDNLWWRHVQVDLPGQRSQRLKHRVIHMDANSNVRYIEVTLNTVRRWLVQYVPEFFGAWRNPELWTYPKITRHLQAGDGVSVETDFKACDNHTSWTLVSTLVLPIYEVLIPDPIEFIRFASFVEELFMQPIFMGSYVLTGLHNLLSGQGITNDFETIYDAILSLVGLMRAKLSLDSAVSLNMGDDIALLLRRCSIATGQRVMEAMIEEGILNGHEFSLDKCALGSEVVHFCRRVHARDLGRLYYNTEGIPFKYGAYPGILTLNSIVNPERPQESGTLNGTRAFIQRLDNTVGNPMSSELVAGIVSRYNPSAKLDAWTDLEKATYYDWWQRVYGDPWTASTSHAIQLITRLNLAGKFIL